MAIQLEREIEHTGVMADHWVLTAINVHRNGSTNTFTLSGTFALWASAAAYQADKRNTRQSVQVNTGTLQGNLTLAQMQSALEAAIIAEGGALEGGVSV